MKCNALLMLILHKLLFAEISEEKNSYIEEIKRFILNNYTNSITVKQIARHVKLDPTYCGALFIKDQNQTISDFITNIRINQAKALLVSGSLISEVADLTGFSNVHYFSNVFKKIVGVSPSTFKNANTRKTVDNT